MSGIFLRNSKRLIFSVLMLGFSSIVLLSQNNLSGILNTVDASVVTVGVDRITVNDLTGFQPNDTVLLIQMQGILVQVAPNYGNLQNKYGEPGKYEFVIIQSITVPTKEIVFKRNLINSYDIRGNIQILKVPYYFNAEVTGALSCKPWDSNSKTGGVLALIVGKTLKLTADINVTGKGFLGAKDTIGAGIAYTTNTVLYGASYYARSFNNAGFKGEGVANYNEFNQLLIPNYMKGYGPNWTGGGGGNAKFAGGGGGSNRGQGGIGGNENNFPPIWGGYGGIRAYHGTISDDRIYLGGGGGASTSLTDTLARGGNGGGIVIIVTESIQGNGGKISANGANGIGTSVINSGSGGGGGGGSIALSLNSYGTGSMSLSANGGKGGDNAGSYGEGGGGGGGLLWINTSLSGNVNHTLLGGLPGNDPSSTASPGDTGEVRLLFRPVLNGFLFNSIRSSITGNQLDSVCSNMIPPKIAGTIPVGGTPGSGYIYLWEKSYNQSTWTTLVNDPDPTNYTPTAPESSTVYYRRTITDHSLPTAIIDISKSVEVIVQPFIKNNIVGNSDTICFAQDPPAFTSKAALQDGNGKYTFTWQVSADGAPYATPSNPHNGEGYTPPQALTTKYSLYRRTVNSGRCVDSTAIVRIDVLDTIANNRILNTPADICYGSQFANLTGSTTSTSPNPLKGGDNSYIYAWQSNFNGAGWVTAPGISNGTGYNPVELPQRIPSNQYLYRRIVYSGSNKVCSSTSNEVLLKDFPVITNNTITPVAAICSGSAPAAIIGSKTPVLSGGNTVYTFAWQDSSKSQIWTLIPGASGADYQPPQLTDSTFYRRIVSSSACSDISSLIEVIVHKPISGNNITVSGDGVTETICNNQQPGLLLSAALPTGGLGPGSYAYLWKSSPDNVTFTPISGVTGINYQPPQLSSTTYYNRQVTSGACILSSNTISDIVLPTITDNIISGNAKVCYSLIPDVITGAAVSGGSGVYKYFWGQSTDGGATWVAASGTNNTSTYQPPALFTPIKYERTVTSGPNDCCSSTSNIFDIGIDPLPVSQVYAGPDTIIYSVEKIYNMKAVAPVLTETGTWEPLNNGTGKIVDTTKYNTKVWNLTVGKNSFLWTIHRGPCKLQDSINIVLLEDFVPQGFSPNGDAWNNTFVIEGLDLEDNFVDLSIVNGAGTEVFKTSNRNNQKWTDWDGKNSNGVDLAEGTYYYLLKVTPKPSLGITGQVSRKKGFIVLKRY